jgi:DNA-binding transcriptional ArsR family regulator
MSLEEERISELRATAHPLRLQMLSLLTGAEMSATEVARELDITQANASYHLRFLEAAGLIVVAGEEKIRGGRAKRYRHPWDVEKRPAEPADEQDVRHYVRVLADAIPMRFEGRQPGEPVFSTDADLWLEPEAWQRVLELVTEASTFMHASAKPPRAEGTVRANLSMLAFRMKPESRGSR